ncbi:MAG: hypothetical protein MJK04_10085, partial [Psychrosphaera sp.]|nr:hypothetical protein [Psychrosphaera sp.]
MSRQLGRFDFIYNDRTLASIVDSFAADETPAPIYALENAYVTNGDINMKIDLEPIAEGHQPTKLQINQTGSDNAEVYDTAVIYGQIGTSNNRTGTRLGYLTDDNTLKKGADYLIMLGRMGQPVGTVTGAGVEVRAFGSSIVMLALKHLSSTRCKLDITRFSLLDAAITDHDNLGAAPQPEDQNPLFKLNLWGDNNGNVHQETHLLSARNIAFAPETVEPEEHKVFAEAVQASVVSHKPMGHSKNRFVSIAAKDSLNCLAEAACIEQTALNQQAAGALKKLYTKPVGLRIRQEINRVNQRKLNTGIFFGLGGPDEGERPNKERRLRDETLTHNDVSVQVAPRSAGQWVDVPLSRVSIGAGDYRPVVNLPELVLSDYFRVPFEHLLKRYGRVRWQFDKIPTGDDAIFILGRKRGAVIYALNHKPCAIKTYRQSRPGSSDVLYSVSNAFKYAQKTCALQQTKNRPLYFELRPVGCNNFVDCPMYQGKEGDRLSIANQNPLYWHLPSSASTVSRSVKAADEGKDVAVDSVAPDIYISTVDEAISPAELKVFDSTRGITSQGIELGLTNLLGFNANFSNHLGGITKPEAFELTLSIDKQIQDMVNLQVEQKVQQLLKGDEIFKNFYSNGTGSANVNVIIQNAKTGEILASGDSSSQYIGKLKLGNRLFNQERYNPEKSPLRWLSSYHNQAFYDVPGSVFKLVNAIGLLDFEQRITASCTTRFDDEDARASCRELNGIDFSRLIQGISIKEQWKNNRGTITQRFGFDISRCHYPLTEGANDAQTYRFYKNNRREYRQSIHNYKSDTNSTCYTYRSVNINGKAVSEWDNIGLATNLKHSVNTWFAWMHE